MSITLIRRTIPPNLGRVPNSLESKCFFKTCKPCLFRTGMMMTSNQFLFMFIPSNFVHFAVFLCPCSAIYLLKIVKAVYLPFNSPYLSYRISVCIKFTSRFFSFSSALDNVAVFYLIVNICFPFFSELLYCLRLLFAHML